ncbi:MAG: hypothetical protein H6642_09090 [Caldilineaceae bacterium]|nr:hypothetical protein [Caldilineaceae bacterium]
MTAPDILNFSDRRLPDDMRELLVVMYEGCRKIKIVDEYDDGQSDTRVFTIKPYGPSGRGMLPEVVKIGPTPIILQEHRASADFLKDSLSGFVPAKEDPVPTPDGLLAGLRYAQVGDGRHPVQSLRAYCTTADLHELWEVLEERLLSQLDDIWNAERKQERTALLRSYDRVLPVSLILEYCPPDAADVQAVLPADKVSGNGLSLDFKQGDVLRFEHWAVLEVSPRKQTLTLAPQLEDSPVMRVRIRNAPDTEYGLIGQSKDSIAGRVDQTRVDLLRELAISAVAPPSDSNAPDLDADELLLPGGENIYLPNPLHAWPDLLKRETAMVKGTIHGDLNMGNVLVMVQAHLAFIIDGAYARHDHVLYDLLRLEMDTVLHPLAAALLDADLPPETIYSLYRDLHQASLRKPHPHGQFALPRALAAKLSAPFLTLLVIRKAAREFLVVNRDGQICWDDYYAALALYLMGATKFASLAEEPIGRMPQAAAFWGAATALSLLGNAAEAADHRVWRLRDFSKDSPMLNAAYFFGNAFSGLTDKILDDAEAECGRPRDWGCMVLRVLSHFMQKMTASRAFTLLFALVLWTGTARLLGPLLAWPQPDDEQRVTAAFYFAVGTLLLPLIIAAVTRPPLAEKFQPITGEERRTLWLLKATGAYVGFVAFAGLAMLVAMSWYYLFRSPLGPWPRRFLVLLPLFLGYLAARQTPVDRARKLGSLQFHDADRLFLPVFMLVGPGMAAFFYWGDAVLSNGMFGLAMLLALTAMALWTLRTQDEDILSDRAMVLLLGLALPLAMLLPLLLTEEPIPLSAAWREWANLGIALLCFTSVTLFLATLAVRNRPTLTLRGALGALGLTLAGLLLVRWDIRLGGYLMLIMVALWLVWGRRRYRRHLHVHPAFWWAWAALAGTLRLVQVGAPLGLAIVFFVVTMALLTAWAWHPMQEENGASNEAASDA